MTPLMQQIAAAIASAERENTGDGHVAAATAFLHRAYAALQDKWDAEYPAEPEVEEAPDVEVEVEA